MTEEKLKTLEGRGRELNSKNEMLERNSAMLADKVSQILEEKKVAERKIFRTEEKLSLA